MTVLLEQSGLDGVREQQQLSESTQSLVADSAPSLEESSTRSLEEVEGIIGYTFNNKNLLEEAFTDASLGKDFSNERLEYIGDSVLNLLFTQHQYFEYPNLSPGPLTRLRAANVDTEKLARVTMKHGLHRYLRHKKPVLEEKILQFATEIEKYPLHSNSLVNTPKVLADLFEATIGAVFIDCNSSIDTVWEVFKELLEPIISHEMMKLHPVTQLYEVCQKRNLKVKFIDSWKENMTIYVFVDGQLVGRGTYSFKKEIAHNRAAQDALNNILRISEQKEGDDNP